MGCRGRYLRRAVWNAVLVTALVLGVASGLLGLLSIYFGTIEFEVSFWPETWPGKIGDGEVDCTAWSIHFYRGAVTLRRWDHLFDVGGGIDNLFPDERALEKLVAYSRHESSSNRITELRVTSLFPFLALGVPAAIILGRRAWRARRLHRVGVCRKCGYDLTGNMSGRCPECGTAFTGHPAV